MRWTLALLAAATTATAQAVTSLIVPSSTPPAGCLNSHTGSFELSIVLANGSVATPSRRSYDKPANLLKRQQDGQLHMSLNGGILTDGAGRTGYIASNYQFQFDKPPQHGAIYTGGFSYCPNNTLALGGNAIWWQCVSTGFDNLYDRDWMPSSCGPVYFLLVDATGSAFSAAPTKTPITGGDQPTIANAGGTQSMNLTATGFGVAATTTSAVTTTTASSGSAASGASTSPTTGSKGAAAALVAADLPQTVLAWAMGLVGALALV